MNKIVGLTGGIGSGKSKIISIFENHGIPCYKSDIKAKKLMINDQNIKKSIVRLFGKDSYKLNLLNKEYISEKVFKNKDLLNSLNNIVHPLVKDDFFSWKKKQNHPFVIIESAILFQSGFNSFCDKIIFVDCPKEIRIKRVINRDNTLKKNVLNRINSQETNFDYIKYSDYVVLNINWNKTLKNIKKIYKNLNTECF